MRIGSGQTTKLLQKRDTKGFKDLIAEFVSDKENYPDSLKSPINAFRAGAILEEVMYKYLPDEYLPQIRVKSKIYDVMTSTLDFAVIENRKVIKFKEMKSINFEDFLKLNSSKSKIEYVKQKYRSYYNQVQQQLFVTDLSEAILMFIPVYDSSNDTENWNRIIEPFEIIEVNIQKDDRVQLLIEERAIFFQSLKNYICQ